MVRILNICGKTSDLCSATLEVDGKEVKEHDGYVPKFMPEGGGDYISLEIDIDTGLIVNWVKPTQKQLDSDWD